jgi:hypothetical protein
MGSVLALALGVLATACANGRSTPSTLEVAAPLPVHEVRDASTASVASACDKLLASVRERPCLLENGKTHGLTADVIGYLVESTKSGQGPDEANAMCAALRKEIGNTCETTP